MQPTLLLGDQLVDLISDTHSGFDLQQKHWKKKPTSAVSPIQAPS